MLHFLRRRGRAALDVVDIHFLRRRPEDAPQHGGVVLRKLVLEVGEEGAVGGTFAGKHQGGMVAMAETGESARDEFQFAVDRRQFVVNVVKEREARDGEVGDHCA